MRIGKIILELRKENGWTQAELADRVGVSEQAVSKWENEICSPDISVIPLLARQFGCSIDRLFGVGQEHYQDGVKEILSHLSLCEDCYQEVAYLADTLKKYPNSNRLKCQLAFSYFMVFRIGETADERDAAVKSAIALCNEVICSNPSRSDCDRANDLLAQMYSETGDYAQALAACDRLSADRVWQRLSNKAQIYAESGQLKQLRVFAEQSLFDCFTAMETVSSFYYNALQKAGAHKEAMDICLLRERILALFDDGGRGFYASQKMMNAFQKACLLKASGEQAACVEELKRIVDFAAQTIEFSGSDHAIAKRNRLLSAARGQEPYMQRDMVIRYVETAFTTHFADEINANVDLARWKDQL